MKITNKKAFFDYEIVDRLEAGINLLGAEVKAVRLGHADLSGSFIKVIGSEAYLVYGKIFTYEYGRPENYEETRTRKLLLHRKEILALKSKADGEKMTLVPLSIYESHHFIKVEIGIGKGKKEYDKKKAAKKRDLNRQIEEEMAS